ncbi:TMEM175 family protein [Humibacter albus]|uniref:TMEM175 family protein n=1 Tax=Humibacter albus TaxID=427754 RepID=UPI0003B34EE7|nr:TMEM175 family protein [Humibacter albus]
MSEDDAQQHGPNQASGAAAQPDPRTLGHENLYSSERAKAFIDAVVAIAMTLLILPLMESASDLGNAPKQQQHAAVWLDENSGALWAFAISFAIIAMFWITHHRLFARVEFVTSQLIWLNIAWLFSIVWMPVATAITGALDSTDQVAVLIYIGSMVLTNLLTLVLRFYLRAHPLLHTITRYHQLRGIASDLAMAILFVISLIVALTVPAIGYFALFLTMLTGPCQELLSRILGVPKEKKDRTKQERAAKADPGA